MFHPIRARMFGIGGMELFIILVVALIVLGPSKMPDIARMLGKAMGELQRATSDLKREINVASEAAANTSERDEPKEDIKTGKTENSTDSSEEQSQEKSKEGN